MPKRIQRKRTKGWRMPPNTVYVGRPTKWGNPYKLSDIDWKTENPAQSLVDLFDEYVDLLFKTKEELDEGLQPLRGKDLVCWCALDQPCHADVLLKLANEVQDETR